MMTQQDKQYAESICAVFRILPADKREYLLGVADGMAAMAAGINQQERLSRNNPPTAERPGV